MACANGRGQAIERTRASASRAPARRKAAYAGRVLGKRLRVPTWKGVTSQIRSGLRRFFA
jgi:hypothetical protein